MITIEEIDGVQVTYNSTTNKKIVTLSTKNFQKVKDYINTHSDIIVRARPTTYDKDGFILDILNLDILKDIDIRKFLYSDIGTITISDFSGLYFLKNLEELDIRMNRPIVLDFSKFKTLASASIYYWPGKTKNLFLCKTLKNLSIWKYDSMYKNLMEMSSLENLETLRVIQSSIKTIGSIEKLSKLKTIELSYNSKLKIDCNELNIVMPDIEELEINTCKNIGLDFLKIFPNLKRLTLVKFQPIPELKIILDGLPKLEKLFVGETKILESDNRYYLNYPQIKEFFFDEKKHHVIKNVDLAR